MSWFTMEQIQEIAPDAKSVTAARKIARPAKWKRMGRQSDDAVWGVGLGSKGDHYATFVTSDPNKYGCTCPSRKRPCKHVLALLLLEHEDFEFEPCPLPEGHRYSSL